MMLAKLPLFLQDAQCGTGDDPETISLFSAFLYRCTMFMRRWISAGAVLALALFAMQPAWAQQAKSNADKYFPDGTDVVIQLNLNQLLGSELLQKAVPLAVRKYGEDVLSFVANFTPDENVKKMMQQLGPNLKDQVKDDVVKQGMNAARMFVQDLVVAINSKEELDGAPQVMIMVRSPFIQASMVDQFVQGAQASGQVKIESENVGDKTIHKFENPQMPQPFYFTLPEDGIVLFSPFKNVVEKALKAKAAGKLDNSFSTLLTQRKPSYTLFAAGLAPKSKQDEMKHFVATLTLDKDITGNVNMECKDAETAKEQAAKANESFENAVGMVTGFADDHPELKPIVDAVKKVKAEVNGNKVSLKLVIKGDDILKALAAAKK
jgi:hypothetical protein